MKHNKSSVHQYTNPALRYIPIIIGTLSDLLISSSVHQFINIIKKPDNHIIKNMKTNLSILLVFLSTVIWAQSSDQNYIKTAIYKQAVTAPAANSANARIEINYFDGLGRPIENIKYAQAPNGGDIITHIEYDDYGRQTKDYLPVVRDNASLDFAGLNESDLINFYQNAPDIAHTGVPFSEKELENSPLNRVLKQAAPGEDWALGSGHEIKYDYLTNHANEVRLFEVSPITYDATTDIYEPNLSIGTGDFYQEHTLFKNITIDENNSIVKAASNQATETIEYKTKTGQTVLKRISTAQGYFDTYYVYDDFGNLTYVIPPKAATQTHITQTILDDLCYQYKYDKRNRRVAKKIPGKQWEYMIYDKLDRLRATGPVASPFSDMDDTGWIFTTYDKFDRPVITYWVPDNAINADRRFQLQTSMNSTPFTYPAVEHKLSINFYDNYNFSSFFSHVAIVNPTIPNQILGQPVKTNVKTLPTGTWERILESSTDHHGKLTFTFYKDDHLNSPIYVETRWYQPYTQNDGGYTKTSSEVDFEGKVLYTVTKHKKDQNSFELTTEEQFTYSPEGRLIQHQHRIGNEPYENIATNSYNLLGQVKEKKVGREATNPLQNVHFNYNIRGWLTDINDIHLVNGELFYFHIGYTDGNIPLYNGNISQTLWKTASDNTRRSYQYRYDGLNRLTEAAYLNEDNNIHDTYNAYIGYDMNGNITGLDRNGGFEDPMQAPAIDQLRYFYKPNSNQLQKVTDLTNDHQGFKDDGNGTLAGDPDDDYAYDAYGNMTQDQNKGIINIRYNHMNLPVEIDFANNRKITYLYTAMGTKLQKTVDYNTYQVITDYRDGYQYETKPQTNGGRGYAELLFFPTAEGYVKAVYNDDLNVQDPVSYQYVYIYKDHLGNNRLSYTLDPETNQIKILEENHYYPFGLKHAAYNQTRKGVKYKEQAVSKKEVRQMLPEEVKFKYKYNGKELQDELGLNVYDYGARTYDPAAPRFWQVDPLAEKYSFQSVYVYADDNPVFFVDINGMGVETDYILDKKTGNIKLIKKTDDKFDRLYATDDNGNIDKSVKPLVINKNKASDRTAISDLAGGKKIKFQFSSEPDVEPYETTESTAVVSNRQTAWKTFKFLADHSDVEWAIYKFRYKPNNFTGYQISTYHLSNKTIAGEFSVPFFLNGFAKVLGMMHSHPDEKDVLSSMDGDINVGETYHRNYGIKIPYLIYFPKQKNTGSIISRYGNLKLDNGKRIIYNHKEILNGFNTF